MDESSMNSRQPEGDTLRELQNRISQLEHLFVNSTLQNTTTLQNYSVQDDSFAAQQQAFIDRICALENLLAASELDNKNLQKKLNDLTVESNKLEVNLLEKIYTKDLEITDLQKTVKLANVKLSKSENRFDSLQKYVLNLPSSEELAEAQKQVKRLEDENSLLKGKNIRLEEKNHFLQKEFIQKERLYQNSLARLEELQPLADAEKAFVKDEDDKCTDEPSLQLLVLQKAQITRYEKLVTSLKSKISTLESQKSELLVDSTNKDNKIATLNDKLVTCEIELETLCEKLKKQQNEYKELTQDYASLEAKYEQLQLMIETKNDQMMNFVELVTEIELCVAEIKLLINFGNSIAKGDVPDMVSIMNLSEIESKLRSYDNLKDSGLLSNKPSDNNTIDGEWVLEKSQKVHQLRQETNSLRTLAQDMYNDFLCHEMDVCHMQ